MIEKSVELFRIHKDWKSNASQRERYETILSNCKIQDLLFWHFIVIPNTSDWICLYISLQRILLFAILNYWSLWNYPNNCLIYERKYNYFRKKCYLPNC